jgi:hypothetical protein
MRNGIRWLGTRSGSARAQTRYVFMQRNCRDIRIPHLWGFKFPDSSAVCLVFFNYLQVLADLRSTHTSRVGRF